MNDVGFPAYDSWLESVAVSYRQSQIKAATAVNVELLKFYWSLGSDIVRLGKDESYGSGFLPRLSKDLSARMPKAHCFSLRNLYYIENFYRLYATAEILPQLGAKLNGEVVVEVKVGEFEPEHLGQLGLYVSAVNHLLKKPQHAPTIGLLICKTKDNVLAKWTLESTSQPIGVSEYRLSETFPKEVASDLPSVSEIESGLKFPDEDQPER
jgi:hypothetical protein